LRVASRATALLRRCATKPRSFDTTGTFPVVGSALPVAARQGSRRPPCCQAGRPSAHLQCREEARPRTRCGTSCRASPVWGGYGVGTVGFSPHIYGSISIHQRCQSLLRGLTHAKVQLPSIQSSRRKSALLHYMQQPLAALCLHEQVWQSRRVRFTLCKLCAVRLLHCRPDQVRKTSKSSLPGRVDEG